MLGLGARGDLLVFRRRLAIRLGVQGRSQARFSLRRAIFPKRVCLLRLAFPLDKHGFEITLPELRSLGLGQE